MNLLEKIETHPERIEFNEVIAYIDEHYHFSPTAFKNRNLYNKANQNNGSCKIFSFAQKLDLSQNQTLHLFGDFYRKDVLEHPENEKIIKILEISSNLVGRAFHLKKTHW